MKIINSILKNNDCFKAGRKIVVKGLMLHSVGCSQPKAQVFINQWNKPDVEKAVHAFIEPDGSVFQTLPWIHRGWHGGGPVNNTHIGVEMTEPATIKYQSNGTWLDTDPASTKAHIIGTYKTAVELFVTLCNEFKLDPLAKGVIISHSEGHALGIASGHSDVEHIWSRMGLTMDQFRKDVKAAMVPQKPAAEKPQTMPTPQEIAVGLLVADGVTDNAGYWLEVLNGKAPAKPDYLVKLINNYHTAVEMAKKGAK